MGFYDEIEDEAEQGFLSRHRAFFVTGGVILFGVGCFAFYQKFLSKNEGPGRAAQPRDIVMIRPLPTPPPPPPPKIQPPPPVQNKMVVQEHVEQVPKPDEKPPEPPAGISTGIKGSGPDDFGLTGGNGAGTIGGEGGSNEGGRWGWYASQVQLRVADALRQNARTRNANIRIEVHIWADKTGRVARARLVDSTGDAAIDNAISSEVLSGLQLQEPPPEGMPMPIILRLTARRPTQ